MRTPDLSDVPFFSDLSAAEREEVAKVCSVRCLERGEALWQEGDLSADFCLLLRGGFKLVTSSWEGHDTIVQVRTSQCLLCASVPYSAAPYCCRSVCLEAGSEVLLIPRCALAKAIDRHPSLAHALLREISARCTQLCRRVGELGIHPVSRRIALLLLHLTDRVGTARPDGSIWIPLPLTRQEIADLCGTTLETSSRVMAQLRRQDIIKKTAHGFSVSDRDRLAALTTDACREKSD